MAVGASPRILNAFWLGLFAVSGAASLTYQIVWQRLLTQEIGVDSVSVTLIVAIFMLGLGFGSLVGSGLISRVKNVAMALAVLELAIGVFGLFSVDMIRLFNRELLSGSGLAVQLCGNFFLLLVPTLAMGATTPLMVDLYRNKAGRGRSVGAAYAANIAGAAVGVVLCGFVLVGTYGLTASSRMVALLDLVVAALFFLAAKSVGPRPAGPGATARSQSTVPVPVLIGVFFIGVATLGYEVVFFRLFTSYFGVTPYVFPMLLFAYLANMAIGTWLGGWLSGRWPISRILAVSLCATVLLSLPILWLQEAMLVHGSQLRWVFNPTITVFELNVRVLSEAVLLSFLLLMPVAASSVLLPAIVASTQSKLGQGALFGRLYFSQTIGNTVGCLITGFVLYGLLDSPRVLAVLAIILAGGVALVYLVDRAPRTSFARTAVPALLVILGVSAFNFDYTKSVRYFRTSADAASPVWARDSIHGMTLVYDNFGNGASYAAMAGGRFWITGIPGKTGWDRTVGGGKMESTVYAINPSVKKILFIGLGTGEELLVLRELYPDAAITVIEVNPDLIEAFREFSYQPIADELKRSKVFLTDGRRFLQTQPAARFDYIHIGVHRASTSGTGNLFSKDFLATLKGHLSPGGVVTFYAYPPVVKGALDIFGDVVVSTRNSGIAITYCTAEPDFIFRSGFSDRYATGISKVSKPAIATGNPPWFDLEPVIYRKKALAKLLESMPVATDDHLVTEYYLNNRTELVPGLIRADRQVDYRSWSFSEGGEPFPGQGGGQFDLDKPSSQVIVTSEQIAMSLKGGGGTPVFHALDSSSTVNIDGLFWQKRSLQWDMPVVKFDDAGARRFVHFDGTCEKRGRGIWGLKAYFVGHDGMKVFTVQSAARGENSLPLIFEVPGEVKEVQFAMTFDNASGFGGSTELHCSEFRIREYH